MAAVIKHLTKDPLADLASPRPKLTGISPGWPVHKTTLCYHGKPGNGWLCKESECSGAGLCACEMKKRKGHCISCNGTVCILCGKKYAGKLAMHAHIWDTKIHKRASAEDKDRALRAADMFYILKTSDGPDPPTRHSVSPPEP